MINTFGSPSTLIFLANEDEKGHVHGILLFSPDGLIGPRNQTGHTRHGSSDAAGATSEGTVSATLLLSSSFLFHWWATEKALRLNGVKKIKSNHQTFFTPKKIELSEMGLTEMCRPKSE